MDCFVGMTKTRLRFGVMGRLLEIFQNGVSHSAFFFKLEENGRWYVVDSTRAGGIKIHTMEKFSGHHKLVRQYFIPATEKEKKQVLEWAILRSYQTYPVLEIIGNTLQVIVKLASFGRLTLPNFLSQGKHYPRCNEAVCLILIEIFNKQITDDLDGMDLVRTEEILRSLSHVSS